jgi:hypothetical protein
VGSVRRRGDKVVVSLTHDEATVLASLADQVAALLRADAGPDEAATADPLEAITGMSGAAQPQSDDPALRRLLPDAYADDASAEEFRRLMDTELRRLKSSALDRLIADLRSITGDGKPARLAPDEAEAWLQAINDVRLVLGTRLEVTEDMSEIWQQLEPEDPRTPLLLAYDWLGGLQESLVASLDP